MNTEKTKGDILAERIESIATDIGPCPVQRSMLAVLEDYRKPEWTLGRSVNGFTLAEGHEWHRTDFTKDMLPEGWRPLIKGERAKAGDEYYQSYADWTSQEFESVNSAEVYVIHQRTRRPLPVLTPAQIADGWVEWHGGDCPVWGGSAPSVILRDGLTVKTAHAYAEGWTWRHCNNDGDIIAYRPDPYEALKKAHSEGKVIQVLESRFEGQIDGWSDVKNHNWRFPPEIYRVKPSPVMVPLGPEDVPPGSAIRYRLATATERYWIVTTVDEIGIHVHTPRGWERIEYARTQQEMEISRDGGKTWQKCEKPEEAK